MPAMMVVGSSHCPCLNKNYHALISAIINYLTVCIYSRFDYEKHDNKWDSWWYFDQREPILSGKGSRTVPINNLEAMHVKHTFKTMLQLAELCTSSSVSWSMKKEKAVLGIGIDIVNRWCLDLYSHHLTVINIFHLNLTEMSLRLPCYKAHFTWNLDS